MIQTQAIKKSFNRAAATYNAYAQTQTTVGEDLIYHLVSLRDEFDHVIDLGCGTGLITNTLANSVDYHQLDAIDIADELLKQGDMLANPDIDFYEMNFDELKDEDCYELVFSNMALHWSSHFTRTLANIHKALTRDGLLAFTIPVSGTFAEMRNSYSTNEFFDFDTVMQLLQSMGYKLLYLKKQTYVNTFSETIDALKSLKNTGTSITSNRLYKSLGGKALLESSKLHSLSYVIGFFIVGKVG